MGLLLADEAATAAATAATAASPYSSPHTYVTGKKAFKFREQQWLLYTHEHTRLLLVFKQLMYFDVRRKRGKRVNNGLVAAPLFFHAQLKLRLCFLLLTFKNYPPRT